jgi:hypothetical protein
MHGDHELQLKVSEGAEFFSFLSFADALIFRKLAH